MARNFGAVSVMAWTAISVKGKTSVCFISTKISFFDEEWIFQQNNAEGHASKIIKEFSAANEIPISEWPAITLTLNVRVILSQSVFKNGRQFENAISLSSAINMEWSKIYPNILKNLIKSMPGLLQ